VKDKLSDLSMKPSKEDLAFRRRGKKGPPQNVSGSVDVPEIQSRGKSRATRASSRFLVFTLLVLLCGSTGGGWYLWDTLQKVRVDLGRASGLSDSLNMQLDVLQSSFESGQLSRTQSGQKVGEKLALLDSEVRKLWDLSNKANKSAIKTNKGEIAINSAGLESLKGVLATQKNSLEKTVGDHQGLLEKQATKHDVRLSILESRLAEQEDKFSGEFGRSVTDLKKELKGLETSNRSLRDIIVKQGSLIEQLEATFNQQGGANEEIESLQQAVNSIDAYRLQVNRRLDRLDREVEAIDSPLR